MSVTIVLTIRVEEWIVSVFLYKALSLVRETFLLLNDLLNTYLQTISPRSSVGKDSAYSAGDPVSIPELGRSPGEGNGNPLQYSCLENPRDRGAW